MSGMVVEGLDKTCVYFATGFQDPGWLSLLVRGRVQTTFIGLGAGIAVSRALVQVFRSTIPIIPALDVQPYAIVTGIVLIAGVIARRCVLPGSTRLLRFASNSVLVERTLPRERFDPGAEARSMRTL